MPPPARPNYGVDAPPMIMTFVGLAVAATFAGIFIGSASGLRNAAVFWVCAALFVGTASLMVYGSKRGKPALWARLLDDLELRGDEQALDVGCGRGLVMIELAKRLPDGFVSGIDIWRGKDQSGNAHVATDLNVAIEGVGDRVEVVDADMTDLPFEDAAFDLVTASLALHNLPLVEERRAALDEMVRVLRPGGRAVIVDIGRIGEVETTLTELGFDVTKTPPTFGIYPPARTITATKPRRTKSTGRPRSAKRGKRG